MHTQQADSGSQRGARGLADLMMFDLDGTLIETAPELHAALNDTLAGRGLQAVSLACVADWIGQGIHELLVQAMAQATGRSADAVRGSSALAPAVRDLEQHYQRHLGSSSRLYPRVREVLLQLHADGVALAVVTNKPGQFTARLLAHHGLGALFAQVISGDTLARKKPAPDGILHCLRYFGVAPERALFIGDSSIDVATARNAGVRVWALPYGYNMGQPIAACGPDRVIADFAALIAPPQAPAEVQRPAPQGGGG